MSLRFLVSLLTRAASVRIAVQQQAVAAHLPALQPVQKAHAEQARLQLAGLRHQRVDGAFDQAADGDAIERHRRGAGAAIGGVDVDRVVEHFERQAGSLGVLAGEHNRARAGVEHHRYPRAVDLRRSMAKSPPLVRATSTVRPCEIDVAGHKIGQHPVGDIVELEAVGVADHEQRARRRPRARRR